MLLLWLLAWASAGLMHAGPGALLLKGPRMGLRKQWQRHGFVPGEHAGYWLVLYVQVGLLACTYRYMQQACRQA